MYYLTMGAIFRSENSWLDEWIRYHLGLGVEHFILFCDEEETTVSDRILQPYIQKGLVENYHIHGTPYETWSRKYCQVEAYKEIIRLALLRTDWLALLDIDEFLLPRKCDDLRDFLEGFRKESGIAISWSIFGTNGFLRRPQTQINHLLRRAEASWERNRFVKSIVRPHHVKIQDVADSHFFPMASGVTVNEKGEIVKEMTHEITTETIRINHYVLRSFQDYWEIKARRTRFHEAGPCDEEFFTYHNRNEIFDDEISRRFGHLIEQ